MFLSPSPVHETFEVGGGVEPEDFEEIFRNYLSFFITFSYETFEVEGEGRTGGVSRKFSQLSNVLSPSPAQETFEVEDRWEYDRRTFKNFFAIT